MAKITQIDSTLAHSFSVALATKYGLFEAILINHFKFWITKNESEDINYKDGRYWSFQTLSSLESLYPYASRSTIVRTLQKLVDSNVLMKGNYNDSKLNRTLWYSFTDEFKGQIEKMDVVNMTKSSGVNLNNSMLSECETPFCQSDNVMKDISKEIYKQEKDESNTKIKHLNSASAHKFVQPTVEDVEDYCQEIGSGISPDSFIDYYTANGWMVGKSHMKDWKAAVRQWERRRKEEAKSKRSADDDFLERWRNA